MSFKVSGIEGLGPVAVLVILLLRARLSVLVGQGLRRHSGVESERQTPWNASPLGDVLEAEFARLDSAAKDHVQRITGSASSALSMMDALRAFSCRACIFIHLIGNACTFAQGRAPTARGRRQPRLERDHLLRSQQRHRLRYGFYGCR